MGQHNVPTLEVLQHILRETHRETFIQDPDHAPDQPSASDFWTQVWFKLDTKPWAITSGQTLLYDTKGHLVFSGGITGGRGHEGDNTGRESIEKYLQTGKTIVSHKKAWERQTRVYERCLRVSHSARRRNLRDIAS